MQKYNSLRDDPEPSDYASWLELFISQKRALCWTDRPTRVHLDQFISRDLLRAWATRALPIQYGTTMCLVIVIAQRTKLSFRPRFSGLHSWHLVALIRLDKAFVPIEGPDAR